MADVIRWKLIYKTPEERIESLVDMLELRI